MRTDALLDRIRSTASCAATPAGRSLSEAMGIWFVGPEGDYDVEAHEFWTGQIAQAERESASLNTSRHKPIKQERLDLHDELAYAEHAVAARLHRYLWGATEHFEEPDDGSDCETCYDEANGLLYGTITREVAAAYRDAVETGL